VNSEHYRNSCSTLAGAWLASANAEIAIERRVEIAAELMLDFVMG
jgi:hypothetical protein